MILQIMCIWAESMRFGVRNTWLGIKTHDSLGKGNIGKAINIFHMQNWGTSSLQWCCNDSVRWYIASTWHLVGIQQVLDSLPLSHLPSLLSHSQQFTVLDLGSRI